VERYVLKQEDKSKWLPNREKTGWSPPITASRYCEGESVKISHNPNDIYATDCNLIGGVLFGNPHLTALGPYLSCLETFGMNPKNVWEEHCNSSQELTTLIERLFCLQVASAKELIRGKKTLGLIIHEYSGPMFNQMQTPWAETLQDDERFKLFIIITDTHLAPPAEYLDKAFNGIPWIWAPPGDQLVQLDFIDAFVALDYASEKMRLLPPRAVRILQPHGSDILTRYSYMFYGAGLMFDYLLCPSFSSDILAPNMGDLLIDLFPREFVDCPAEELTLIPFGNMKLDSFISRCADAQPTDIIYNFSCWKLESEQARVNSVKTVECLLETFPDNRLVFRPFPGDEDCHRTLIDRFSDNPRFVLSTGASYIEDYRNGVLLIYHRGSSSEIFSMATLQPAIRFDEKETPPSVSETAIGFEVYSLQQLIDTVRAVLASPQLCRERLLHRRTNRYPDAGRSLTTFLDQLHVLLIEGRHPPSWRCLPLYSSKECTGRSGAEYAISKALKQGDLIPMLGSAVADAYPDVPLFQLYAAWSIFVHIYPNEFTPDPWLLASEYLSAFFRQAGNDWERIINETGSADWLAEQLPIRLLGLWERSTCEHDASELERLQVAIQGIPLNPFVPGSIPGKLQERLEAKGRVARRSNDLLWRLARNLYAQGEWEEALRLVSRGLPRSIEDELLICRIFYRTGDIVKAYNLALRLYQKHPSPELIRLVFAISACLSPVPELLGALLQVVQRLPDDADCLAFAVNLARYWKNPELSGSLRQRLASSTVSEASGWRELLPL